MTTAYVSVDDLATRDRIVDLLARRGWEVGVFPTGFHLLSAIADVIDGAARDRPALLVVDAFARGCTGLTIAAGLRDLGVDIPLFVVTRPGHPVPACDDQLVHVADPAATISAISALAGLRDPGDHRSEISR